MASSPQSREIHDAVRGRVTVLEETGLDHEKRIGRLEGKLFILLGLGGSSFAGIVTLIVKTFNG